MRQKYHIVFSVNLGAVLPHVGELCNELENPIGGFGFRETIIIRSNALSAVLTTARKLTKDEEEKVKRLIISKFQEMQPAWQVHLESFKWGGVQVED